MVVAAPPTDGRVQPPDLTADEQHALREFWRVLEPHYEAVALGLDTEAVDHPEASGLIGPAGSTQRMMSRGLIRNAITHDDWLPYLMSVDEAGARYAEDGLAFGAWFGAGRALRGRIVPLVIDALRSEPDRLATAIRGVAIFIDLAMVTIGTAYLVEKERIIATQQEAILELSTPVLELGPGLLLLPLIGVIDTTRAAHLTTTLLEAVSARRTRLVVLDVTGVPAIDTAVANHLMQTAQATRLMGADAILAGLSATNAHTLAALEIDLGDLRIAGTLAGALAQATAILGQPHSPTVA